MVLDRQLAKTDLRVCSKVRLADAIAMDGLLPRWEFDYETRARFDFLVVDKRHRPIFAVEFDGPQHAQPHAVERDALKNRLCDAAHLPLLRITSAEIEKRDQHSVLDYMLVRYVAWPREVDGLRAEIEECAQKLPDDVDPDTIWQIATFCLGSTPGIPSRARHCSAIVYGRTTG